MCTSIHCVFPTCYFFVQESGFVVFTSSLTTRRNEWVGTANQKVLRVNMFFRDFFRMEKIAGVMRSDYARLLRMLQPKMASTLILLVFPVNWLSQDWHCYLHGTTFSQGSYPRLLVHEFQVHRWWLLQEEYYLGMWNYQGYFAWKPHLADLEESTVNS